MDPGKSASKSTPVPRCNTFHRWKEFYWVDNFNIRSHLFQLPTVTD